MTNKFKQRNAHGQGLVEGVVGVCMIFGSGVAATLLLVNSGTSVFFKEKLAHMSHLAVQYAASHAGDSAVETETTAFVQELLPQMGMTPSGLAVTVKEVSVKNCPGIQVTVTNAFPVFGGVSFLPTRITLSDSDCVVF